MKAEFDTWMYSKDGAKLFEAGEPIPAEYVDSPAKVGEAEAPKRRGRPPKKREGD